MMQSIAHLTQGLGPGRSIGEEGRVIQHLSQIVRRRHAELHHDDLIARDVRSRKVLCEEAILHLGHQERPGEGLVGAIDSEFSCRNPRSRLANPPYRTPS